MLAVRKVTLSRSAVKDVVKISRRTSVAIVFDMSRSRSRGYRPPHPTFETASCFRLKWSLVAEFRNIHCRSGDGWLETFVEWASRSAIIGPQVVDSQGTTTESMKWRPLHEVELAAAMNRLSAWELFGRRRVLRHRKCRGQQLGSDGLFCAVCDCRVNCLHFLSGKNC